MSDIHLSSRLSHAASDSPRETKLQVGGYLTQGDEITIESTDSAAFPLDLSVDDIAADDIIADDLSVT